MCTSRIKLQHFIHSLYSTHKVHHNNQCILPHHMQATLHSNRYVNEIYIVSKKKDPVVLLILNQNPIGNIVTSVLNLSKRRTYCNCIVAFTTY